MNLSSLCTFQLNMKLQLTAQYQLCRNPMDYEVRGVMQQFHARKSKRFETLAVLWCLLIDRHVCTANSCKCKQIHKHWTGVVDTAT